MKVKSRIEFGKKTCIALFVIFFVVFIWWYENPQTNYKYGRDQYYTMLVDDICDCYPSWTTCDEYERINILRRYVYTHTFLVAVGGENNGYTNVHDESFNEEQIDRYAYELTHMNTKEYLFGGMTCGGFSWTLMNVYKAFGYDSVTLDMAVFDDNEVLESHVVCLVRYNGQWIVEDPTFDCTFINRSGKPIAVYDMMNSLDKGEISDIVTIEDNEYRYVIYNPKIVCIDDIDDIYEFDYDSVYEQGGYAYLLEITDIDFFPIDIIHQKFIDDGYEDNALYFYEYPYDIYRRPRDIRQIINTFEIRLHMFMYGHKLGKN